MRTKQKSLISTQANPYFLFTVLQASSNSFTFLCLLPRWISGPLLSYCATILILFSLFLFFLTVTYFFPSFCFLASSLSIVTCGNHYSRSGHGFDKTILSRVIWPPRTQSSSATISSTVLRRDDRPALDYCSRNLAPAIILMNDANVLGWHDLWRRNISSRGRVVENLCPCRFLNDIWREMVHETAGFCCRGEPASLQLPDGEGAAVRQDNLYRFYFITTAKSSSMSNMNLFRDGERSHDRKVTVITWHDLRLWSSITSMTEIRLIQKTWLKMLIKHSLTHEC